MPMNDPEHKLITFDVDGNDTPASTITPSNTAIHPESKHTHKGLCFISFGSGSSGNCAYLGTQRGGILIDAGIDIDNVFPVLERNGIKPDKVKGIILTHDHQDHVRYAYRIVRKYKHIRIYCTMRLMKGMLRKHNISSRVQDYQVAIYKEIPFRVMDMEITAFETSHDGSDNMGFHIQWEDECFVVGSDMGIITPRAEHYMALANHLMIESNYNHEMLEGGRYPEILKDRVRGAVGHLDNAVAAQFVADHYDKRLQHVFLCHLSNDNNTPDIARATMREALERIGVSVGDGSNAVGQRDCDVQVYALPRFAPSLWFVLA